MIASVALLAGAIAVCWSAPMLLGRLDPLVALVAWVLSIVGVLVTTAAGIALLLIPDHGPATDLLSVLHHCWVSLSHGATPRAEEFAGLLGTGLFLALATRFAMIIARAARRRGRVRREHLAVLRLGARRDEDSPMTLWLDHDRPLAFSLAGRPGVVVATEGLTRHLAAAEVAAVIAHERAHLRGRHHLLIAWVDALAAALPFVPLFRQATRSVRELVELSADAAAVRACGADAVRSALLAMSAEGAPGHALAMARNGVEVRLARLQGGIKPAGRLRRMVSCGLIAITALTLPIVTGASVLLAVAVVSCPLTAA